MGSKSVVNSVVGLPLEPHDTSMYRNHNNNDELV